MRGNQFLQEIAESAGLTVNQVQKALDAFRLRTTEQLKKGKRVTVVGLGTFSTSSRKARMGRNPMTGGPLKMTRRRVAKFKAGNALRVAINKAGK